MKKNIPQRMCVVCKQMKDKTDLIRIVKTSDGLSVDPTGKQNGRGAYVCRLGCADKFTKAHGAERAFKVPVSPEQYEALQKEIDSLGNR